MVYRLFLAAFLAAFLIPGNAYTQLKTGWTQYCGYQFTTCIESQGDVCWVGNYGEGLFKIDIVSGNSTRFTNLNSGLPSNLVNDITSGPDSIVWIATESGLASFDGHSWHVFDRSNAPFACNNIKALVMDGQGSLWVSSVSGFYCYRNAQWIDLLEKFPGFPLEMLSGATKIFCFGTEIWLKFSNYYICFNNGKWERFSEVSGLCISSDRTRWYLSTRDKTLIGLRGDSIESITVPVSYLSGSLFIDSSDMKWIFRNDTLYCKKPDQWSIIAIPQNYRSSSNFSFLHIDDAQCIWLAATTTLLHYTPSLNEWKSFTLDVHSDSRYFSNSKVTVDADNRLWVFNSGGLYYFNAPTWIQSEVLNSVSGAYLLNVEKDNTGRLNVAASQSMGSELILNAAVKNDRTASGTWAVTQCTMEAGSCVMACFDPSGNSWIYHTNSYTHGFGLMMLHNGKCQSMPYPVDSSTMLNSLSATDNGTLWALTSSKTLFRYGNGVWEKQLVDNSIHLDTITGILGAAGDTLWIGAGTTGLVRFDGTNWKSFKIKTASSNAVLPLYYDRKKGELWSVVNNRYQTYNTFSLRLYQTYSGEGLYCFDGTTGTMYTPANSGLIDANIRSVAADSNGLWVAGTCGLAHWDRGHSAVVSKKHGNMRAAPLQQNFKVQSIENKQIELYLDSPGNVSISMYSLTGRLVRTIEAGKREAGYNIITLSDVDKSHHAQNCYVVRISVKNDIVVKK